MSLQMKALLSQDVKALILFTRSAGSIAVAVTTGAVLPDLVLPVCCWHCCLEHYFLETLPCQDFLDCTFARVDSLRTVLDKNKVTFADDLYSFLASMLSSFAIVDLLLVWSCWESLNAFSLLDLNRSLLVWWQYFGRFDFNLQLQREPWVRTKDKTEAD